MKERRERSLHSSHEGTFVDRMTMLLGGSMRGRPVAVAVLVSVLALLAVPTALAGPPSLCGKFGCTTLGISFGELGSLLDTVATPAPPPPVKPYFTVHVAAKKPLFVVPYGKQVFVKSGSGWRSFSRSFSAKDVSAIVEAMISTTAYDAPIFDAVKVGSIKAKNVKDWVGVFGEVSPGGSPFGTGYDITLLSPQDNPWSKTAYVYFPATETVVFGGKAYHLSKQIDDRLKSKLPAKEKGEPEWELLAQGLIYLALFVTSWMASRWRRRQRPGQPGASGKGLRSLVVGLAKVALGLGFIALALDNVPHSQLIWYIVGGLVVVVSGVSDLLGLEFVNRWFGIAPVIYLLGAYAAKKWG